MCMYSMCTHPVAYIFKKQKDKSVHGYLYGKAGNSCWTEIEQTPLNVPCFIVFTWKSFKCLTKLSHERQTNLKSERIKKGSK